MSMSIKRYITCSIQLIQHFNGARPGYRLPMRNNIWSLLKWSKYHKIKSDCTVILQVWYVTKRHMWCTSQFSVLARQKKRAKSAQEHPTITEPLVPSYPSHLSDHHVHQPQQLAAGYLGPHTSQLVHQTFDELTNQPTSLSLTPPCQPSEIPLQDIDSHCSSVKAHNQFWTIVIFQSWPCRHLGLHPEQYGDHQQGAYVNDRGLSICEYLQLLRNLFPFPPTCNHVNHYIYPYSSMAHQAWLLHQRVEMKEWMKHLPALTTPQPNNPPNSSTMWKLTSKISFSILDSASFILLCFVLARFFFFLSFLLYVWCT